MTQPESKVSQQIIKTVNRRGGYAWKVHGNEFTPAGTPDVVGVFRGCFIGAETKMGDNKQPSAIQEYRANKMREAGGFVISPCFGVAEMNILLDLIVAGNFAEATRLYGYGIALPRP